MKESNTSEDTAAERDIFSDPAMERRAHDPVADFIKRQWRPLLVAVVLAFAVVYIRDAFRESHQRGLDSSANAFFEAQEAFKKYKESAKNKSQLESKVLPDDQALKEKELKQRDQAQSDLKSREDRVQQTLVILTESMDPYRKFAAIISALVAHEKGDAQGVRSALKEYSPESLTKLKGSDRFVAELALIALGRSLLDSSDGQAEGTAILTALAQNGETVAVSAALTLSRIAVTDQEKKQAQELLTMLATKFPEQATVLKE